MISRNPISWGSIVLLTVGISVAATPAPTQDPHATADTKDSHAPAAAAHAPTAANESAAEVTPELAMTRLIEGNERYVNSLLKHPNITTERRCDTFSNGQHPFATILSCADSRAPVEYVFDQGIGDLFVIRVAGNVADTDEIGTIEYGVHHLHSPLVVVMGHTKCGAVTAVANHAHVSKNISLLIDNIEPAVETARKSLPGISGDALIQAAVDANVLQSIADMISNSEDIRLLVAEKKVMIVGAVYDIHSGAVRWLGQHPSQQALLASPIANADDAGAAQHAATGHEAAAPVTPAIKPAAERAKAVLSKPTDAPIVEHAAADHAAPAHAPAKADVHAAPAHAPAKADAHATAADPHAAPKASAHAKEDAHEPAHDEPPTRTSSKRKPAAAAGHDAAADEADAHETVATAPHETAGWKGMILPGSFLIGSAMVSMSLIHFMKGKRAAKEAAH